MIELSVAELETLASGVHRIGIFFRIDVNPTIRLWLGAGRISAGRECL